MKNNFNFFRGALLKDRWEEIPCGENTSTFLDGKWLRIIAIGDRFLVAPLKDFESWEKSSFGSYSDDDRTFPVPKSIKEYMMLKRIFLKLQS